MSRAASLTGSLVLTPNFIENTSSHPYQEKEVEVEDIDDDEEDDIYVERGQDEEGEADADNGSDNNQGTAQYSQLDRSELERKL